MSSASHNGSTHSQLKDSQQNIQCPLFKLKHISEKGEKVVNIYSSNICKHLSFYTNNLAVSEPEHLVQLFVFFVCSISEQ